jgi:ABC-2 type transport system ATP-binding protein
LPKKHQKEPVGMTAPMIQVRGLGKIYGRSAAVRDLTFDVRRGECFGLLGPNGAGKTTALNMIAGLLPPTAGDIRIAGIPLNTRPLEAKASIGIVPQELALYPALSARENLVFFGRLYGLRGRGLAERLRHALDAVGLAGRDGDAVAIYSSGMKRRLNLAAGILHDPPVLILDEPTVGIDAHSRHTIVKGLEALARSGKTLLYSTHHLSEAEALCSRVAVMDSGGIIALDTPLELIRRHGSGIIRIELEPPVADRLLRLIRRFGAFTRPERGEFAFQFQSAEPESALEQVLKHAHECGAGVRAAQLLEPTLETVFLNLTGRSVSD